MAGRRGGVVVPISTEFNSKGLQAAGKQLDGFGKTVTKQFAGIGAALAGAFTLGAISDQVRQMIDAGSRLQESQSKVGVVFGDSARQINAWADTASSAMVMSKQSALEAAGTFGNLFQAFGIAQGKAGEMSTTLVQLAADLASFNNSSTDDAIQAIRSGLSGETEPLKRFGVALNDARLKAEAFNMGIYDGKGILDAQQKSLAAYSIILKDTKLAQGDVARTADNYANTMRSLQAAVSDAQATIGTELVKSIADATKAIGGTGGITEAINGAADSAANFTAGIGDMIAGLSGLQTGGWNVAEGFKNLTMTFYKWFPLSGGLITSFESIANSGDKTRDAEQALNDEIARSIQMRHIYNPIVTASAQAARDEAFFANKAAEAQNKLNGALERRNANNRSIIGANIRLRELRKSGPQDTNGDKKVSMDERKAFGLDYASTIDQKYNALVKQGKLKKADALLANARNYLGTQVSPTFATNILGTPKALPQAIAARAAARSERGANEWRRSMSAIFGGDVTIKVEARTPAEAVQKAKEWARLAAAGRGGPALPPMDSTRPGSTLPFGGNGGIQ